MYDAEELTVGRILQVLTSSFHAQVEKRVYFYRSGRLVKKGLLRLNAKAYSRGGDDLTDQRVTLDRRVLDCLVGLDNESDEVAGRSIPTCAHARTRARLAPLLARQPHRFSTPSPRLTGPCCTGHTSGSRREHQSVHTHRRAQRRRPTRGCPLTAAHTSRLGGGAQGVQPPIEALRGDPSTGRPRAAAVRAERLG